MVSDRVDGLIAHVGCGGVGGGASSGGDGWVAAAGDAC
jgi:hypothetical protein